MKKLDFTVADRTMSTRVEEYVKCRILRKKIQKDYSERILALKLSMDNLDKLKGSLLEDKDGSERQKYADAIKVLEVERDNQLSKEATFEFTDGDKAFRKALKGLDTNNEVEVTKAIIAWFKNYNLDVTDTYFLHDICLAIGGKEDYNKLVDSDGINGLSVDNNRALSMLYWVAFNAMVVAGTISKAQIPDIIKNNFGKKARAEKRAQKKSNK